MGKINVLGFDVANLIAAGEVVDRPASVVKELCENSIDAGATQITVEIKHGGTTLIRVSDNGCGIEPDDMPLTVLRHATSKIATAEDLAAIGTLGFRGEALAAIASVCKLKMYSRLHSEPMGAVMTAEGGEIIDIMETGCSVGTTVIATELFYNVPARRKFLKKDASECAAVTAVMEKIAMSAPQVSVQYITDGERRFKTAGDGKLLSVIYAVFGKDVASRMTPVDRTDANGIRVVGYIGEPDLVRANKNSENFFINNRFVKSRTAMAALEQAYSTRIAHSKFPVCVLNLMLNPAVVDVNVHPSKLEVKFANERIIFEAVYYAVLNALQNSVSRPEMKLGSLDTAPKVPKVPPKYETVLKRETVAAKPQPALSSTVKPSAANAFVPVVREKETRPERVQIQISSHELAKRVVHTPAPVPAPEAVKVQEPIKPFPVEMPAEKKQDKPKEPEIKAQIPDYHIIGEAYNCYVIVQLYDRILMIDKHAAHERILFDEMCERIKKREKSGQVLMFPVKIKSENGWMEILEEHGDSIKNMGFDFKVEGGELLITQIPPELSRESGADMIEELLSKLASGMGTVEATSARFFEEKLYQASCKAAIKGGRVYDIEHIKWICDRLLQEPDEKGAVIKTCPHGRPVAFEIKKTSIERQFERLV